MESPRPVPCTKPFNFDAFVANDDNTNAYDKSRSTELDLYGNPTENTNKDENVKKTEMVNMGGYTVYI